MMRWKKKFTEHLHKKKLKSKNTGLTNENILEAMSCRAVIRIHTYIHIFSLSDIWSMAVICKLRHHFLCMHVSGGPVRLQLLRCLAGASPSDSPHGGLSSLPNDEQSRYHHLGISSLSRQPRVLANAQGSPPLLACQFYFISKWCWHKIKSCNCRICAQKTCRGKGRGEETSWKVNCGKVYPRKINCDNGYLGEPKEGKLW